MSASAISITTAGSPYTQNFDSPKLATTTGTGNAWANDSTITGWHLFDQSGSGITTYNAGNGSSGTGNFYSYGTTDSGERALGGLGSNGAYFGSPAAGAVAGWMAVSFLNGSGSSFIGFTANWDGEQWRNGRNTTPQTMVFEYGFGASFGAVSWTAPGTGFDFVSPVHTDTAAALDGNLAANRQAGLGGKRKCGVGSR